MSDFAPRQFEDGSVLVSAKQMQLHRTTELLSFALGAPLMLWIATRKRALTDAERIGIAVLGVGAIAVDGYLWLRFHRAKQSVEPLDD